MRSCQRGWLEEKGLFVATKQIPFIDRNLPPAPSTLESSLQKIRDE